MELKDTYYWNDKTIGRTKKTGKKKSTGYAGFQVSTTRLSLGLRRLPMLVWLFLQTTKYCSYAQVEGVFRDMKFDKCLLTRTNKKTKTNFLAHDIGKRIQHALMHKQLLISQSTTKLRRQTAACTEQRKAKASILSQPARRDICVFGRLISATSASLMTTCPPSALSADFFTECW